ncbi:MAG: hypothetical protein DHS20C01_23210 [marine bacterium B5-7]|nr:MAG: hypothetical protein DHS20C01_23210 [marine bacterium B5-7]
MSRKLFNARIAEAVAAIADRDIDENLADYLNSMFQGNSEWYRQVSDACLMAVDEGWMCEREAGGIRYGRVTKPFAEAGRFSVDVVLMDNVKGPWHVHPQGEVDLVMPLDDGAMFDGHGAGWVVYPGGSGHYPTVTGGKALVLYLLPEGKIDFTPPPT